MKTEIFKTYDVINKLLIPTGDILDTMGRGSELGIFVHSSIYKKCKRYMKTKCRINIIDQCFDYQLKVNEIIYDMKLVYIKVNIDFEVEKFIHLNHLVPLIVTVETRPEVISFKKHDSWRYKIFQFANFSDERFSPPPPNYYQVIAFPWLQPSRLKHFEKSIHPKSYRSVHLLLTCLRKCGYNRELHINVLDLCNLRLAFCDERGMNENDADLACKIDSLILRELTKLKSKTNLFTNNQFNASQYMKDRSIRSSFETVKYFQYKFQNCFDSIEMVREYKSSYINHGATLFVTEKFIDLVDDPDLEIVSQMPYTRFTISCFKYDQINISKLIGILNHRNVTEIVLDTNQKWLELNESEMVLFRSKLISAMETINRTFKDCGITFKGGNTHNFVENCLLAMKEFKIWATLKCKSPLQNCNVFNETLFRRISFESILITSHMLEQLHISNLNETKLVIQKCKLQNETSSLDLIFTMKNLRYASIIEDELTWQCICEFVAEKLTNSELKLFKLSKLEIYDKFTNKCVDLANYTFELWDFGKQIVVKENLSDTVVHSYWVINKFDMSSYSDYDFYN